MTRGAGIVPREPTNPFHHQEWKKCLRNHWACCPRSPGRLSHHSLKSDHISSSWKVITGSQTGTGQSGNLLVAQAQAGAPGEQVVLVDLEAEMGAEDVKEVLGDYLSEDAMAVWDLLLTELGLTGGESTEILEAAEAMEVDQPMMLVAEVTHLPMDTGQSGVPSGTFQPELTGPV